MGMHSSVEGKAFGSRGELSSSPCVVKADNGVVMLSASFCAAVDAYNGVVSDSQVEPVLPV